MIRALAVGTVMVAATLRYGAAAIRASRRGIEGELYADLTRRWSRAILRASGVRVVVHGGENLRPGAPQIVVSNHVSFYDVFALASALPVAFHFVAKKELERIPFFGTAWKAAGHVSIDRSNRQRAVQSLRRAGEKIRRENSAVIIFPEGTRSRTGQLMPFKKGAFVMAQEAGVPVVPAVILGSGDVVRRRGWSIRPRPIHIHFGAPVQPSGEEAGPAAVEGLQQEVRRRMEGILTDASAAPPPSR